VTSDSRIDVKAGQPVRFSIAARTQLGTGSIVRTEWDFNGLGTYPVQSPLTQPRGVVFQGMTYTFMKPGTYFPVVRVSAQRDTYDRYGVIQNLARVRVVVH
jgi:PKD domain-containing protein